MMVTTDNNIKKQKLPKAQQKQPQNNKEVPEIGGRGGLDPVRYGDWEVNGKTTDF
ncbi:MAG: DUF1674 domain-containing protein [Pseudomonadota bacterium]